MRTVSFILSSAVAQQTHTCGDPATGPVLGGVDVVATLGLGNVSTPVMGSADFVDSSLGGYKFYFASASNLKLFQANSTKYAPRYGGY